MRRLALVLNFSDWRFEHGRVIGDAIVRGGGDDLRRDTAGGLYDRWRSHGLRNRLAVPVKVMRRRGFTVASVVDSVCSACASSCEHLQANPLR
jgi:hypothetical protein